MIIVTYTTIDTTFVGSSIILLSNDFETISVLRFINIFALHSLNLSNIRFIL